MKTLSRISICLGLALVGCTAPPPLAGIDGKAPPKKRDLVIWGVSTGPDIKGIQGVFNEFERRHPDINLRVLSMGAGGMNNQKLMTSIVGNVAPDVINQDRFEISDWASRGAFEPLDDDLKRDASLPDCPKESQYYKAPWQEASYGGHVYGIPTDADDRALYWNKNIFDEKADDLRAAGLDPTRPPHTWSEILAYSKVLTILNPDGSIKRAGFIPNFGNSWLYIFAFMNNASFMSADGKTCTLDTPYSEEALEFMKKGYDIVGGYENSKNFESGFQTKEQDPFLVGKVAMKIDGDWILNDLSRYGPHVNFVTSPPPVPDDRYNGVGRFRGEKDKFISWIGGYAYAIPRGAKNTSDAWTFIKFATSDEGRMIEDSTQAAWDQHKGRTYIPRMSASEEFNEIQVAKFKPADPRFALALVQNKDLMKVGRVRPPTFVSNLLWQEQVKALDNALYGKYTIQGALQLGQSEVQHDLDDFYNLDKYPIVNLSIVTYVAIALVVIALAIAVFLFLRLRLGTLAKREAQWAYLFIAPWIIGFVVFTFGPMLASLFFSFTQYNVLNPAHYVGLKNYADMGGADKANILKAFGNVAYLAGVGVPLGLSTGLAIALLLNAGVRGMRFYRTFFYMPAIVPVIASTVLWAWILTADPNKGLINSVWNITITPWLHVSPPGWLSAESWAKPALILMGAWGAGSGMVLWLAGLKSVPNTLYEAAGLDGASPRAQFWNITLPMLSPVIFFNVVMGFIGALQEFDRVFVLKSNDGPVGPGDAFLVPVYHLFNNGFAFFRMGYASALAWLIFVVILMLTLFQFKMAPRWVHYEADK